MSMASTYQPPQGNDPFTAMGGGVWTGTGWVPKDHPEAAAAPPPQAPGTTTPPSGFSATPGNYAAPPPPTPQQRNDTFTTALVDMLSQPMTGLTTQTDPVLRGQSESFRVAQERGLRRNQEALAERYGSSGLERSATMDSGMNELAQGSTDAIAGFDAQLVGNELTQRRNSILQALQVGADVLSTEQKLALQQQLGELDATIRREGYGAQKDIAGMDNATRQAIANGQLNLGLLNTLVGNQNFNDQLGYNYFNTTQNANAQALMAIIEGWRP